MTALPQPRAAPSAVPSDAFLESRAPQCWKLLVADEDECVHAAVQAALAGVELCGAPLQVLHARNIAEARRLLEREGEFAAALIRTCTDTAHEQCYLASLIRDELGMADLRIVLRVGAGDVPDGARIRELDISDYQSAEALTAPRLIATFGAALRSYSQIRALRRSQDGLDRVLAVTSALFSIRSIDIFCRRVVEALSELLGAAQEVAVCLQGGQGGSAEAVEPLAVVAATDGMRGLVGREVDALEELDLVRSIRRAVAAKTVVYEANRVMLYFGTPPTRDAVVCITMPDGSASVERRLLELFAANLRIAFENVSLFARFSFFAYCDPLTGLPNRVRFVEEVDRRVANRRAGDYQLALLDLARFSEFNDALGHRSGDALLIAVAKRLRAKLPESVLVARVAGDSFGLFGERRELHCAALPALFADPFYVRGHAVPVQVHIGVAALSDENGRKELSGTDALRNASLALNQAKRDLGVHVSEYSAELAEATRERVLMLNELRAALDFRQGLTLFYQPQIDTASGAVIGAEALVRWRKDNGALVPPDRFIPLAEHTGLIVELGDWAFETACRQLVAWDAAGLSPFTLAVNVSAAQFRNDAFVGRIRRVLAETGASPHRLELEITESVAMEDIEQVVAQLGALRKLGLRVALDDFGCGFSSLSSINRLPFDLVKIDRAFVARLTQESAPTSIANMVLQLAEGLSIEALAEGVETEEQVSILQKLGCAKMQGFLFGRPMPSEGFVEWCRGRPC
jgi:diguanylate cyclase (GGDEF)-like protein